MNNKISIYTIQLAKHRLLHGTAIKLIDITVKSGDKFFAPEWEWVMAVKKDSEFQDRYIDLYRNKMAKNYKQNPAKWLELLSSDIALGCYCNENKFCHRHLLAGYLLEVARHHGILAVKAGEFNVQQKR